MGKWGSTFVKKTKRTDFRGTEPIKLTEISDDVQGGKRVSGALLTKSWPKRKVGECVIADKGQGGLKGTRGIKNYLEVDGEQARTARSRQNA